MAISPPLLIGENSAGTPGLWNSAITQLWANDLSLSGGTVGQSSNTLNPESGNTIFATSSMFSTADLRAATFYPASVSGTPTWGSTQAMSISGNAATATLATAATALATARTIGGVSFDGTANITVASATGGFAVSGGGLTFTTTTISTTAQATLGALSATQFSAYASTVSGATLQGYGTTGDATLKNRAGNDVLIVLANTLNAELKGTLLVASNITQSAGTAALQAVTGTTLDLTGVLTINTATATALSVTSTGTVTNILLNNTHANDWGSAIELQSGSVTYGSIGLLGALLGSTDHSVTLYATTGQSVKIYANAALNATFSSTGLAMNSLAVSGITTLAGTGAISGFTTISLSGLVQTERIRIDQGFIIDSTTNAESAISLNYAGYNGGTTQFRTLNIYDGKNVLLAQFVGNGKTVVFGSTALSGITTLAMGGALTGVTSLEASSTVIITAASESFRQTTTGDSLLYHSITSSSAGTPRVAGYGVWATGTNSGDGFVGTISNHGFRLNTNDTWRIAIANSGAVSFNSVAISGFANLTQTTGTAALQAITGTTIDATSNIFAGAATELGWTGRATMKSSADGIIELFNDALSGFTRLNFGGTSTSFPSLKRSSATLQARLADDSDYATFHAKTYSVNGTAGASGTGTVISAITVEAGIITAITVA